LANALRISLRYGNLETIEHGYGINLLPLATFALETYPKVSNRNFKPRKSKDEEMTKKEAALVTKMHKAISIIQFKVEGQLIRRNPDFKMDHRLFLETLDIANKTIIIEGKTYELNDVDFPTIDLDHPYRLTEDELEVIQKLKLSFENSDKLQQHTAFLYRKGSMYLKFNGNLLYHGGMPINDDLTFKSFELKGHHYSGKALFDIFEHFAREAYYQKQVSEDKQLGLDLMWYLWNGECSPLFAKKKMTTFERYFINDKSSYPEISNPYFSHRDNEPLIDHILKDFDLDPNKANIISGHVPVKTLKGEDPVKANKKMFVIDGGFSKAYHETTGIAGYTLTYNSRGLILVSHEPFDSLQSAIHEEKDMFATTVFVKATEKRVFVNETDVGEELRTSIESLHMLLDAYRKGLIKEKNR
jgi:fructose-1,6-bisphosphatase-3